MESNQTASRAAKRFLQDRVRNDWAYPDVPPVWSASDEEVRDAQDFCERYYGESESGDSAAGEDAGPCEFVTPESMRNARRKRRRQRLEEEMQQNEGLRLWVERRDMWTGATSVRKYGTRRRADTSEHQSQDDSTATDACDMVPVAPRLLPQNSIRASITPNIYSDIFQKIVVSSRTPSVPINLVDMTNALVQGWRDSDEWPPRAGLPDPLIGKKRAATGPSVHAQHGGFMDRHPHLEKGVGSVKRILHLNGGHHSTEHTEGGTAG